MSIRFSTCLAKTPFIAGPESSFPIGARRFVIEALIENDLKMDLLRKLLTLGQVDAVTYREPALCLLQRDYDWHDIDPLLAEQSRTLTALLYMGFLAKLVRGEAWTEIGVFAIYDHVSDGIDLAKPLAPSWKWIVGTCHDLSRRA